ncbi:MAG TPA: transketolase C-terminal domain-containing protein, partial [Burkholderiales bacterium]|nr:transketolase C-terminal domain-containing protein [Burkholderiales bacterium]
TVESAVSWACAVERKGGPSSLIFSRQNLKFQTRNKEQIDAIRKGGYVLSGEKGKLRAVIIATGSEVELAMQAQKILEEKNIHVRVVSMPSTNVFDRQDASYRESVLPKGVVRVAVEAGVTDFWRKYVGLEGDVVGMDTFGESAPAADLFKHFGFTVENVVSKVTGVL